jgi:hypothetical protein
MLQDVTDSNDIKTLLTMDRVENVSRGVEVVSEIPLRKSGATASGRPPPKTVISVA